MVWTQRLAGKACVPSCRAADRRGEVGAAPQQHISCLDLVLDLVALEVFFDTQDRATDHGSNIRRLTDTRTIQRIKDTRPSSKSVGSMSNRSGFRCNKSTRGHRTSRLRCSSAAAGDLVCPRRLAVLAPTPVPSAQHQTDQTVLIDQNSPAFVGRALLEEVVDRGRLSDAECACDEVYRCALTGWLRHGVPSSRCVVPGLMLTPCCRSRRKSPAPR